MMAYPTAEEVERADVEDLIAWVRFLPSPTDEQRPVMIRILDRARDLKAADPAAAVAASKRIGF